MSILNDFNINQLKFDNFPTDKVVKYLMHGNVYQYGTEFYINSIFVDDDKYYYLYLLPLKALSAFPIGAIFKNQRVTSEHMINNILDVKIILNAKLTGFSSIDKVDVLKEHFASIPNEISGYPHQQSIIMQQLVAVYRDHNTNKTIYIPHYEIARWYFLRSSSLSRQVLSANLEGLYFEANYLDEENSKAEIIMKYGSSNQDATEIFRFAQDEFANIMFHNFSLDLSANKKKYTEEQEYEATKIRANFPVYGELNIKARAVTLDRNHIFVYQILEEDSLYPFDELNIYRYEANTNKDIKGTIRKKSPNKHEMKEVINDDAPNINNVTKIIDNRLSLNSLRKGLENKKILFKPALKNDNKDERVIEKEIKVSGFDYALSLSDAVINGGEELVHASIINQINQDEEELQSRNNNLKLFKQILFRLIELDRKSEESLELGVNIIHVGFLPKKPDDYEGRAQWKKAYLSTGKSRGYMIAELFIANKKFYVIEIEKEDEHETIATVILYQTKNLLHINSIHKVIRDYVQYNGQWKLDSINKFFLYHVGCKEDVALRLYKKLRSIVTE